ncbi:MAG: metallophosphoesterase [Treponema sp.]|jgi:predicted phosphodiesterase|nr:metallophosphoesterase [Treponema sp.]
MKILAIPDVHGSHHWKKAKASIKKYDKIIFLGDYFDCWENKWPDQMDNFLNIVNFKKANPDKVELCIGNHDHQYLVDAPCSGHQSVHEIDIKHAVIDALDVLNVVYKHGDWLFSHAGFSREWMKEQKIADPLDANEILKNQPHRLNWAGPDPFGDNPDEGPLWIRPNSLLTYFVNGYNQCVGHTEIKNPVTTQTDDDSQTIAFIDTPEHSIFFEVET